MQFQRDAQEVRTQQPGAREQPGAGGEPAESLVSSLPRVVPAWAVR